MMRRFGQRISRLALALLAPAATVPGALAQAPTDGPFAEVRAAARESVDAGELPSVAIAVAADGRVVWEAAFGWADRERGVEATPHTPYSLASITKPITATAVMILAERGLLALDRPVDDYLGAARLTGLGGDPAEATVARVLSHTAGLPLHYQFFYEDEPDRPPPMEEAIGRYGVVLHPPGEAYEYSNFGYGILDHVIGRASGVSYEEFLEREIFRPLGMTRSAVGVSARLAPHAAARYDGSGRPLPAYDFDHRGGSAVYASAHDLVRFGLYHLGSLPDAPRLLADSTLARMREGRTPQAASTTYGLGWILEVDERGYPRVGHSGGMPGVRTVLHLYPEEGVVVAVLANAESDAVFGLAAAAAAAALPRPSGALSRARPVQRRAPALRGEGTSGGAARAFAAPAELAGVWTGELRTWEGSVSLRLVVPAEGGAHLRMGEGPAVLLVGARWQDGWLSGLTWGDVRTSDTHRAPYALLVRLRLRDGVLSGPATAHTIDPPMRFALTSWARLTKEPATP